MVRTVKPAFHDTDIDTDTDTSASLRQTRAISWRYSCGKLNGEISRHADILATIIARKSAMMSVVGVGVVECGLWGTCQQTFRTLAANVLNVLKVDS